MHNIKEAVEAACIGARVLMCYISEDDMVNDIKSIPFFAGYEPDRAGPNNYRFDGGGSIIFLTLGFDTSLKWDQIHFHEGNPLARVTFPGAFKDVH